ncbi:hypothetical protein EDB19DRAFT_2021809 [Suillus lakei]|nr:hypothetical protein EDB19DRAFT_2021809 [Suillus lakei]
MAANSTELMWEPGFIGFVIATAFYGTAFGQYLFYVRWFPQDSRKLKLFIMMVFCFETIHQYSLIGIYWSILISCRRSTSLECTTRLPWQMLLGVLMAYWIIFAVQCFYAYRVWISECSRIYESEVSLNSSSHGTKSLDHRHYLCARYCIIRVWHDLKWFNWSQLASFASASGDAIITGAIWWFLRPARTDNVRSRSRSYLNELMWIFIQMGLFSFIVATTMVVLYQFQDGLIGQFYTAAPGAVLGKSYMNSMMAVLNARKSVRERERLARNVMELPTIPTIR